MSRLPAPEIPVVPADPDAKHGMDDIAKSSSIEVIDKELARKRKGGIAFVSSISKDEPVVTRRELWSYYLYYNGDNGVGPNGYSMTLFQSLANAAGFDPVRGPGSSCSGEGSSGQCVVPWAGGTKAVSSVVLIANGVCFAVSPVRYLVLCIVHMKIPYVDHDLDLHNYRFLLQTTFASMTLTSPSRWGVAMALYMVGFISYGATLVFYAALFPRLARNTAHARKLREQYDAGLTTREEYEREESLEKNRISNISTTHSNIGYIITLCLNLSLLLPLVDNPLVDNYVIVLTNAYWVIVGIWWCSYLDLRSITGD
ncbi:hypothetical protein VNI00_014627 [Paramarasmius palmivorus]|uniref:Autophagy-related protein n=1 Tax=Paramarasmius palmivorus TaxID=297713 RepID=A0AAW0BS95_9AGAR